MAHLENLYNIPWVIHNNKVVDLNSKLLFQSNILHSSESLVYNRFYIGYDYNHYNIVYNQCSIYSGTKFSISNLDCPPFDFFYHCSGISLLYIHVCPLPCSTSFM